MVIETKYGNVEIGDAENIEGAIYADYALNVIPEDLQNHINEIIRIDKRLAFEKRKDKLRQKGYSTLEALEKEIPIKIGTPYIGLKLDLIANKLEAVLNVQGYDTAREGIYLEFYHTEHIAIDPRVILELLLAATKKTAPPIQTMSVVVEDMY